MAEKRKRSTSPYIEIQAIDVEADEWESKKMRTETALKEPHTPPPLTEENLRSLQRLPAMSQPKKSRMKDDTAESSSTKASIGIRKLLRINHLLMDERKAFDRYPKMKAKCEELITRERHTGMTEEEPDQILDDLPYMMESNSTAEQGEELLLTAWKEDHLARVRNQMFDSNSIPALDPGNDKILKDLLLSLPKLEAPKPNYCFGLREEAFTPEEQSLNDRMRQYTVLSKPLYHCFFAVQFKTLDGEWGQCQTQCCRAGAAMVHATEKPLRLASPGNKHPLKDYHLKKEPCMAFTLAVNPVISELNVHWAEPSGKGTIYHMHNMRGYFMKRGEQLKDLRHDVNRILDWGCVDRKTSIQEILANIKAKNDSMPTPSLATPSSMGGKDRAADENWEHVSQISDTSGA